MKKLNEDMTPELLSKKAEGEARIAKFNADIAALQQQIAKIAQQKSDIETELAKITSQSASSTDDAKKKAELAAQAAAAAVSAGSTSESLIESIDPSMDEESRIYQEIDKLADQIVYYQEHYDGHIESKEELIEDLIIQMSELQDRLSELEKDQMEHEADYEDDEDYWIDPAGGTHYGDEDDPAAMYEDEDEIRFSGRGPGDYIDKRNWYQKPENLIKSPKEKKVRKPREKRMTKREYERELKDVMNSLKADIGDYDHSIVFDLAENLYYNELLKDYVIRRWKKEQMYDMPFLSPESIGEPSKQDILEIITNDLEMSESYNPMSIKNFYNLNETIIEDKTIERNEEEFLEDPYVFYIRAEEDTEPFIGKIYKISPDGDWFGKVIDGDSDTFEKISYEPDYDEDDIVDFLLDTYEDVEIIDSDYAEGIEDDYNENDIIESKDTNKSFDNSRFKYKEMWDDLDSWAEENKWPTWSHQKKWIRKNAENYGINIPDKIWGKILQKHDELHKKFYFQGWDIDQIPWIEKQIEKHNTIEEDVIGGSNWPSNTIAS